MPRVLVLACRQHSCQAPLPLHIQKGGLVGQQLTSLIAYMKGVCHASFSTVRTFLRDVVGVTISRGLLAKIINKVANPPWHNRTSNCCAQRCCPTRRS